MPGPLLADDAGDPELGGLEHALLFKKLPRPARKGGSLLQTAGLLKEEFSNCVTAASSNGRSLR